MKIGSALYCAGGFLQGLFLYRSGISFWFGLAIFLSTMLVIVGLSLQHKADLDKFIDKFFK